jgi:hypothetical protein
VADDNRRERLTGSSVPFRRQLIRLDTERQRVTPARRQQVDGEREGAITGSFE